MKVRIGELEFTVTNGADTTKVEVTRLGLRKDDAVASMSGRARKADVKVALKTMLAFIS